ncbi:MAG: hypothetical protein ACLQPV_06015 [Vulcanimicrobiaceae bacterium]
MKRILFVSNGHGERAIADRIAAEVCALSEFEVDHLALVGEGRSPNMRDVGPQRAMPSGGLIAMGNARNIVRDLRGGLAALTIAQLRFLRASRGRYSLAVAVGDVFAFVMAGACKAPVAFVGTAKSVRVAPYGPMEERLLRSARGVFVRDGETAERLRADGVRADALGNAIVDLYASDGLGSPDASAIAGFDPFLALLPGSRSNAYADARFLASIVREVARGRPNLGAALSIAPGLDGDRFADEFSGDGWRVDRSADARWPFSLREGDRTLVRAWSGPVGALFARAALVLGQAGTANEAAAAAGIPIVAFRIGDERKGGWYRRRQQSLLGEALTVLEGAPPEAAAGVAALLDDAPRRAGMARAGRERMGLPGGSRAIAQRLVALAVA